MPPGALSVTLTTASAAWLALFLTACADSSGNGSPPAPAAASAAPVSIRYVTHRVLATEDLKRVSEYFTGREDTGGDIVRRTDSRARRGLYFLVALGHFDRLPDGATAVLEFVAADKPEPFRHHFVLPPLRGPGAFQEIRLGVTGADWPESNPDIIAWKITLRDPKTGAPIVSAKSFLWELPPKK